MAHKTLETEPRGLRSNNVGGGEGPAFAADTLLKAVAEIRDRQSFIELFQYFAPRIKSFLIKGGMDMETADELAQETMLTVWNKAEGFDPAKAAASTWIFTIARNKKIDFLRKRYREGVDFSEQSDLPDDAPGPSDALQRTEEEQTIAAALETLPAEQAELIQKSFFEGKSHTEIAEETKIPLGTVKSRIRLALERLRGAPKVKDLM
jgi:RNA polymerase sigma-70 factor, ECF subfamily